MDPNACLQLIDDYLEEDDEISAEFAVEELRVWIARGGFDPEWDTYPHAADFFDSVVNP